MFSFLKKDQTVLDEESITWLFECFGWALQHLGNDIFANKTILVIPSNHHFPGKADSIEGISSLIFSQVATYAGMSHWPYRLMDQNCATNYHPPKIAINGALRSSKGQEIKSAVTGEALPIVYDPNQINNPEAMIATFAHTLAHYLASMAPEPPPGGEENWPQATEVVAVFLGFGVMFANSAYTFRAGGCGSCSSASERTNFLSQYDITYALAIFAQLKEIPVKQVTPHLKSTLRGYYKQCIKDISKRATELAKLNATTTHWGDQPKKIDHTI